MTLGQINALYEQVQKRKLEEYHFYAAVHGAKLKDDISQNNEQDSTLNESLFKFGNSEDYASLTEKERQEQTEKMMKKHKQWISQSEVR